NEGEIAEPEAEPEPEQPILALQRVLVAQVPHAQNRWGQVGLNQAVVDQFFGVTPNSAQRLRLRHILNTGAVSGIEIRGIRMSDINRNRRLEIGLRGDGRTRAEASRS